MKRPALGYDDAMRTPPLEHVELADDRHAEAITLLAQAFHGDPPYLWLFDDPERRGRVLPRVFGGLVPLHAKHAQAYAALDEGELVGVSLWAPCGLKFGVLDYLRHGLLGLLRNGIRPILRMLRLDEAYMLTLAEHAAPEDLYLSTIGVLPDRQGQGIGGQMLAQHLSSELATNRIVWLWTNSDGNERLYTRHGFATVLRQDYPDPRGYTARLMRRPAGSVPAATGSNTE